MTGYLGVVEVDSAPNAASTDEEGEVKAGGGKELLITWVPDELLEMMDEEDKEGYKVVEGRTSAATSPGEEEEDGRSDPRRTCHLQVVLRTRLLKNSTGFVFVSVPPPRGEKYAFSVPISGIYSILVYPVSAADHHQSHTKAF